MVVLDENNRRETMDSTANKPVKIVDAYEPDPLVEKLREHLQANVDELDRAYRVGESSEYAGGVALVIERLANAIRALGG
jgi:hypothetical protein